MFMSKLNPNIKKTSIMIDERLAGGTGLKAAKQDNEALLRRAVLACLLFEDIAYQKGKDVSENIASLIPLVDPNVVSKIAMEARFNQKLRHVPLYIASEMLKYTSHKGFVSSLLPQIITRSDQITDMLSLYWKDGKKKLASQLKKGLAESFGRFNEYSLAKYDRNGTIKLRDVMFLCHPKPANEEQKALFTKVANRTLEVPDTWEVALSIGKDKKETWTRLIDEGKLGALALLRNLRNMISADVHSSTIRKALKNVKSEMLLPLNFIQAEKNCPIYSTDINEMMLRTYQSLPKLPGKTIFIVDVSGSMNGNLSNKSTLNRIEAATALAILAQEQCESIEIWCTAGSDGSRIHQTQLIKHPSRGFGLRTQVDEMRSRLGEGGIFTRQCLEHINKNTSFKDVDRIMVFSDSQDCDIMNKIPSPFGKYNYIIDVSSNNHGINYKGKWTAEISGFSENFITYIAATEGISNTFDTEEN